MDNNDEKKKSRRELVITNIISIIFAVVILFLSLTFYQWSYHVFFKAYGNRGIQARTLFLGLAIVIMLIIVISLSDRLSPNAEIITL